MLLMALATALGVPASAQLKPSTDWESKTVPVDIFAQFPMVSKPRISPDGKTIAAKIRANGKQVLALLTVGQAGVPAKVIAQDDDFAVASIGARQIVSYEWLDSDHLLIGLDSYDNADGEWFDNIRYAAYDRVSGKTIPLGWENSFAGMDLLWASNSGTPHVLLSRARSGQGYEALNMPEVIDVDAVTGATHTVMPPNPEVRSWEADESGVVRFGYKRDADTGKLKILYRPDANSRMTTIYNEVPDRTNPRPFPSIMLAGSDKAYATSAADGYNALYEFDMKGMKLGTKVYGVPGYDIDSASVSPDGTRIEGITVTRGRTERVFFDPRLKEIQSLLEDTFGKDNVLISSADRNREKIVFRVARLGQAQSWFIFDTITGGMSRIAYDNDVLKDAPLNPVSVVRYPASDGKQIEAILTMPRHRAHDKKLALVILPHGGPWARDNADWDAYGWAQAIAEQGYVVIQPNYRGSTGYGRDWEKMGEGAWGYRMQDDLNDAITWLAGKGTIDAKRVCMFGWSYGGYAASRAAERDGDKYRCAISGAGVHDLPAMVRYDKNYLGRYGAKMGLGSASANLIDASPGLHPEKYSTPILIIQGAKDTRVPPSQSRDLVARLKRAGKVEGRDFVYIEQPLNTHNLLREPDRIQVLEEVSKFLHAHNPA